MNSTETAKNGLLDEALDALLARIDRDAPGAEGLAEILREALLAWCTGNQSGVEITTAFIGRPLATYRGKKRVWSDLLKVALETWEGPESVRKALGFVVIFLRERWDFAIFVDSGGHSRFYVLTPEDESFDWQSYEQQSRALRSYLSGHCDELRIPVEEIYWFGQLVVATICKCDSERTPLIYERLERLISCVPGSWRWEAIARLAAVFTFRVYDDLTDEGRTWFWMNTVHKVSKGLAKCNGYKVLYDEYIPAAGEAYLFEKALNLQAFTRLVLLLHLDVLNIELPFAQVLRLILGQGDETIFYFAIVVFESKVFRQMCSREAVRDALLQPLPPCCSSRARKRYLMQCALLGYYLKERALLPPLASVLAALREDSPLDRFVGLAATGVWAEAILEVRSIAEEKKMEVFAKFNPLLISLIQWAEGIHRRLKDLVDELRRGVLSWQEILAEIDQLKSPEECPEYLQPRQADFLEAFLRLMVQDQAGLFSRESLERLLHGVVECARREKGYVGRLAALESYSRCSELLVSRWLTQLMPLLKEEDPPSCGLLRQCRLALSRLWRGWKARRELAACATWVERLKALPLETLSGKAPPRPQQVLALLPRNSSVTYCIPQERPGTQGEVLLLSARRTRWFTRYRLGQSRLNGEAFLEYEDWLNMKVATTAPEKLADTATYFPEAERRYFEGVVKPLALELAKLVPEAPFAQVPCLGIVAALHWNHARAQGNPTRVRVLRVDKHEFQSFSDVATAILGFKVIEEKDGTLRTAKPMGLPLFQDGKTLSLVRWVRNQFPQARTLVLLGCRAFRHFPRGIAQQSLLWEAVAAGFSGAFGAVVGFFSERDFFSLNEEQQAKRLGEFPPTPKVLAAAAIEHMAKQPPGQRGSPGALSLAEVSQGIAWPVESQVNLIAGSGLVGAIPTAHLLYAAWRRSDV